MAKKLLVAQSGGPTPVINSALAGVLNAVNVSQAYDEVLGSINGIEGVIEGRFISMNKFRDARRLSLLKQTPSSYLGSCRKKLPADGQVYEDIFDIFKKNDICAFVCIGGNDSMDTVNKLSKYVEATGKDVCIIGVPKTIDNDLVLTDHTPGFGSAAKYITNSIRQLYLDTSVYDMKSIIVAEIMGRNAGYIALWCGIANGAEDILLPEKYDFNEQNIINNIINNRKRGKTHHIIINAEGIGHSTSMARRIEAATGIETRATILGYMQRGGSPTAKDRYYASIMGAYAVDVLLEGKTNRVVGYQHGEFVDFDIEDALNMEEGINEYQFEIAHLLAV